MQWGQSASCSHLCSANIRIVLQYCHTVFLLPLPTSSLNAQPPPPPPPYQSWDLCISVFSLHKISLCISSLWPCHTSCLVAKQLTRGVPGASHSASVGLLHVWPMQLWEASVSLAATCRCDKEWRKKGRESGGRGEGKEEEGEEKRWGGGEGKGMKTDEEEAEV